jgi:hypothetical protein
MDDLPFDIQELIWKKVHQSYMKDITDELIEFVDELNWRNKNNLGDDLDDWNTDMTSDTEESNSEYSFVDSESAEHLFI